MTRLNRFDHHIRTPKSKWDGAFRTVAPGPAPFSGLCEACAREVVVADNRCPDCRRFIPRPT